MENQKFVVKEVNEVEQKSKAQVEEELLQKHEDQFTATESDPGTERVDTSATDTSPEETKDDVLSEEEAQEPARS